MTADAFANRAFGELFRVRGREDLHGFLLDSVSASGGKVVYASSPTLAPVFLGVQLDSDERLGLVVYPFRITRRITRNRPSDEVRGQLRYGSEGTWRQEHTVGRDVAGVDVTLIVGIDLEDEVLLGLDAQLWDPLPMGISFYAKTADLLEAQRSGWHVWEKVNRVGTKRPIPRSPTHFETLVAFKPERLIDYARLERKASSLRLDPALRFAAASVMTDASARRDASQHVLEQQFNLTSPEILEIISGRNRLAVAVRGGVAEYHLEQLLRSSKSIAKVNRLDVDALHDFDVTFASGDRLRIECKNASPKASADGTYKVEVQKTRSSKNDPASRFYPADAFDVVAACLFSVTGRWEFRFGRTSQLPRHGVFGDRLAAVQKITPVWTDDLLALMCSIKGGTI
ncbi:hypothetical protein [Mycobacterium sp. NPDC050041]|uniref:hypothetical protein n=1 Tax=Mycobacterium sp. NPDC050041 TaxID=3364293 RepID=UPI003C2F2F3F